METKLNFILLRSSQLSEETRIYKNRIGIRVRCWKIGEDRNRKRNDLPTMRNSKIRWKEKWKEGKKKLCFAGVRKLERETRFLINSIRAKEAGNYIVLFRYVLTRVNNHLPREYIYIYIYKSALRICCFAFNDFDPRLHEISDEGCIIDRKIFG